MQHPGVQAGPQGPGGQPNTFPLMFGFSRLQQGVTIPPLKGFVLDAESHEIIDRDQLAMPVKNNLREKNGNSTFALLHAVVEQICAYYSPEK
eukprot:scaffold222233_cov35-Prasinocladus_malaysianus.AAC.1